MDILSSQPLSEIESQYYVGKFDKDEYARISRLDKYGVVNNKGEIVVPCIYDDIMPVEKDYNTFWRRNYEGYSFGSLGYSAVFKEGKWGVINKQHQLILKCNYDKINTYSEGLFSVIKRKKCGCISLSGEEIVPFVYEHVSGFNNGYAVCYCAETAEYGNAHNPIHKNHRYGIIDNRGKKVVDTIYAALQQLPTGVDFVAGEAPSSYSLRLDVYGKKFGIHEFEFNYHFVNGFAIIRAAGDKYGAMSETGHVVIPPVYDSVANFNNKFFLVNRKSDTGRQYFLINNKGEITHQTDQFNKIHQSNGYLFFDEKITKYSVKEGLLNDGLNVMLPAQYYPLRFCRNGLLLAKDKAHSYLITISGDILLEIKGWDIDSFKSWYKIEEEKSILVFIDKQLSVVDSKGKVVKNLPYSFASHHNMQLSPEDYFYKVLIGPEPDRTIGRSDWLSHSGKWGLLDKNFEEIISPLYNRLSFSKKDNKVLIAGLGENIFTTRDDDGLEVVVSAEGMKCGVINFDNEIIVPVIYDWIEETDYNLFVVYKGGKLFYDYEDDNWFFKDGKKGVVNAKGIEIIPTVYDFISIRKSYIFGFETDPSGYRSQVFDAFDLFGNKMSSPLPEFKHDQLSNF